MTLFWGPEEIFDPIFSFQLKEYSLKKLSKKKITLICLSSTYKHQKLASKMLVFILKHNNKGGARRTFLSLYNWLKIEQNTLYIEVLTLIRVLGKKSNPMKTLFQAKFPYSSFHTYGLKMLPSGGAKHTFMLLKEILVLSFRITSKIKYHYFGGLRDHRNNVLSLKKQEVLSSLG